LPDSRGSGAGAGEVQDFVLGQRLRRCRLAHRSRLSAGSVLRAGEDQPWER
jgi:hypothetical protein